MHTGKILSASCYVTAPADARSRQWGREILAVFILETGYPSERTWASLFGASDNSSECNTGTKTDYLSRRIISVVRL